jgi:cytochrome c553
LKQLKSRALACLCVCAAMVLMAAQAAPKAKGKPAAAASARAADVGAGRVKSESERCQECHGLDGNGNGQDGKFAKLAGQYPGYIVKQLQDFRSGARKHDLMGIMARSLDEPDLADIAAYYAGLERMHGADADAAHADIGAAARLFAEGDAARGIAACAACHGARGKGIGDAAFPVIGGQEVKYLQNQLLAWRSGERRNSAAGVMNTVAKGLTDAEIDALAHYVSAM